MTPRSNSPTPARLSSCPATALPPRKRNTRSSNSPRPSTEHGVDVSYGIHPVAGRMPGHMNVLLAEANAPYQQMKDLDEINPEFARTDVVLVVGANDVTNPAARRPGNAVSGMPILNVDQAKSVIVIKRSLGHGYAGIDNELYTDPKTAMLFSDAKVGLTALLTGLKAYVH